MKVGDKLVCREDFGDHMDTVIWYKKHESYRINAIKECWFENYQTAYFIDIDGHSDFEFKYLDLVKYFYSSSELRRKKLIELS